MGASNSHQVGQLHGLCDRGDVDGIVAMLASGQENELVALVNERDAQGLTPLMVAAKSVDADKETLRRDKVVRLLLENGANVNARENRRGWTCLHFACSIGAVGTVQTLINGGVDPFVRDFSGLTPQQVVYSPLNRCGVDPVDGDNRVILPKSILQEIGTVFRACSTLQSPCSRVEIRQTTPLTVAVTFSSWAAYKNALHQMDFIQIMYVQKEPWILVPVIGCFKKVRTRQELEGSVPEVVLEFEAPPASYSYRAVYVEGELASVPETLLVASDVFHVDMDGEIEFEPQTHVDILAAEVTAQTENDEKLGEAAKEEEFQPEDIITLETETVDRQIVTREGDLKVEIIEYEPFQYEVQCYPHNGDCEVEKQYFMYGAPWEMDSLVNPQLSEVRDSLVREKVFAMTKSREIWRSQWTTLIYEPPETFSFAVADVKYQARIALETDSNLSEARLHLVPSHISEATFWRAYFWHVEQIKLQVTDIIFNNPPTDEFATVVSEKETPELPLEEEPDKNPEVRLLPLPYPPESQLTIIRAHIREKIKRLNSGDLSNIYSPSHTESSTTERTTQRSVHFG
mmetsp:Transcript_6718/g.10615  ORF Transcript_6718/g.10615 Transcript_6718/m.10615 type:complete len:572 (+) Transcript_6718:560-2275(+)|eukprot:CAMPEP_0203761306 /NCGR_PEP_ID=MMETSP0098-20131031/14416_1 /ASSEMBLY_ACC=CAM_ASM_000208 /TAXON_ID=96639 /ORGANISM=" , Strain NY0313808BC1" /LENGTH=571 /DNA_ID=CAMNT_0050655231 /DNA_START=544 /DNA_END=2259 /DNA_ORIENTATION=+